MFTDVGIFSKGPKTASQSNPYVDQVQKEKKYAGIVIRND